ncbi:hypothetical protein O181_007091 [Austropuccinia psidii MF-1]|uniref:Uncharacterized protein n=1 Tax=Austropuccinia psidii MF-1 TaxID=1389203 RepID=A0A9Q3BM49_9BASI|nr:hypothetical protein [Austropuccinia psidii MF-1]
MQMVNEIKYVKSSIDLELGKLDAKLNKITSDINDLKNNDRTSSDWYKLKTTKLDSITDTCDRIESKCQVQDDAIEDLSISHINEQLKVLRHHVLGIVNNTNFFATHLKRSDSERKKLKDELIANVEGLHNNYEPNSHTPRSSKPLTEERISMKQSFTPFLGENAICAKGILKLEEWPTFSGEGEYYHIEFIRTIDILQANFHLPSQIIMGKLHSFFTRTEKNVITKCNKNMVKMTGFCGNLK